jgi:hypothetical protein
MARDRVLTLVVTTLPLGRRIRRLPGTLRAHYARYRCEHGVVGALIICWVLAGTTFRVE